MKKLILVLCLTHLMGILYGQVQNYPSLIKQADSLYNVKQYNLSAFKYCDAFRINGWSANANDRYNAACSWALANYPDSSFYNLTFIATKNGYNHIAHISKDPDLISLHSDKRWAPLLKIVKANEDQATASLNMPLINTLKVINEEDQKYRLKLGEIEARYGWESREMKAHWSVLRKADSINTSKVTSMLDKYGWLGQNTIGQQGNSTLFLVIQHSNQITQEKYLPMLRTAVKDGNASLSHLALLEDRVALGKGEHQIYGSQIGRYMDTKKYYVRPLKDPENVNKRRSEMGLQPIEDYIKSWQIKWDADQYKKDLPSIIKSEKSNLAYEKSILRW